MPIALLMLQVGAARLPPITFDLAKARSTASAGCAGRKQDEITVCGKRDPDRYRVKPIAGDFGDRHVSAEAALPGNVTAGVHGQKSPIPNGAPPRIMFSLTKPF